MHQVLSKGPTNVKYINKTKVIITSQVTYDHSKGYIWLAGHQFDTPVFKEREDNDEKLRKTADENMNHGVVK